MTRCAENIGANCFVPANSSSQLDAVKQCLSDNKIIT